MFFADISMRHLSLILSVAIVIILFSIIRGNNK
nr:MAG TPA: CCSMST1 family protein [Bacteriophage sp.]